MYRLNLPSVCTCCGTALVAVVAAGVEVVADEVDNEVDDVA